MNKTLTPPRRTGKGATAGARRITGTNPETSADLREDLRIGLKALAEDSGKRISMEEVHRKTR